MRLFYAVAFAIALAALLPFTGTAQFLTQAWAQRYTIAGNGNVGMVTDASGNVYVAGTSNAYTAQADFLLIKYNAKGAVQWTASYNSTYNDQDQAVAIGIDNAGNVYVTGSSKYANGATTGIVISTLKYSPAGARLWATLTQVGSLANDPLAMTVDGAGNVYIVGDEVNTPWAYDFLTIKINTNGVQQWTATYNGTANTLDNANAVAVDAAGNVYVTGESWGQSDIINRNGGLTGKVQIIDQSYDYVTIKYNSLGEVIWTDRYNGTGNTRDIPSSIALDAAANVYVTGQSGSSALTLCYTTVGALQWAMPNTTATNNTAIAIDPSGNVVTAGYYYDVTSTYLVTEYTSTGILSWMQGYYALAPPNGPSPVAMALDAQGSIYITGPVGTTTNFQTASFNYLTIKYASTGTRDWVATYSGPSNAANVSSAIVLSHPSSLIETMPDVVVTGLGYANSTGENIITVRYSQINTQILGSGTTNNPLSLAGDGLSASEDGLPAASTTRLSNYPNPYKNTTTISYTLPADSHVSLQVYDLLGRPIATLVNENESAGVHNLLFNSGRLAAGIYQYRLVAGSAQDAFTETKSMIIK